MVEASFNQFTVVSQEKLPLLEDVLHDEHFFFEDVSFDDQKRVLKVPVARCFHCRKKGKIRFYLLWWTELVPVLRCCLYIKNVISYTLDPHEGPGDTDTFEGVVFSQDKMELEFRLNMTGEFTARVESLEIEYQELEFRGEEKITRGFLPYPWESGPNGMTR